MFFNLYLISILNSLVLLPQTADHDAASLLDNDNNIKITSEASQPPTSESKGMFDEAGYSGEEEVDKDGEFPSYVSISSQKSSKQSKSTQVSLLYILPMLYHNTYLFHPCKCDAALNAKV